MDEKTRQPIADHKTLSRSSFIKKVRQNALLISTLLAVIVGAALGFGLRSFKPNNDTIVIISYPGELFLRALKLLILPFVISCIIIGTASLNVHKNGKIAIRTLVYFFLTSTLNVILGIVMALLIHPGTSGLNKQTSGQTENVQPQSSIVDGFLSMGRNLIPDNIFLATIETTYIRYEPISGTNNTFQKIVDTKSGTNMIGVVMFFVMFGSVLGTLGSKQQLIIDLFTVIYEVLMKLLTLVIWTSPLGVSSIICGKIASVPDIGTTLDHLAWFILTVLVTLALYQFFIIQGIYYFFIRKNPYNYYRHLGPSLVTAFVAASKSASLSITFNILEEEIKLNKRVTRFILPLGNLNMDGAAAYMAVGIIFIAQMNMIPLGLHDLVNLWITITFLSMSLSTVPSACLVHVVALCNIIGAPVSDVSLLFAVEWILDRARTTNNMIGDCYAVAVIQKLSEKELAVLEQDENLANVQLALKDEHTKLRISPNNNTTEEHHPLQCYSNDTV